MYIKHTVHIPHPIDACVAAVARGPRTWFPDLEDDSSTRVGVKVAGIAVHKRVVVELGSLIKDLVTDVSWNYEVNKEIPPFTPSEEDLTSSEPWRMQQKDVDRTIEFRKCIECFLCQDVCHVLRNHDGKGVFYGPRFMARIASLEMHPKDTLDRRPLLQGKAGVGFCNITKCCTEVCPEHIKITDNAIIPLKERMDDTYFDPVRWALQRLGGGQKRGTS